VASETLRCFLEEGAGLRDQCLAACAGRGHGGMQASEAGSERPQRGVGHGGAFCPVGRSAGSVPLAGVAMLTILGHNGSSPAESRISCT
jgi:hypothetical protein